MNSDSRNITEWEKTFTATPENTPVPDESRLPTHWLAQGAGYHGSVTDALWALRDLMLKDALSIQRTLPFEALCELTFYKIVKILFCFNLYFFYKFLGI